MHPPFFRPLDMCLLAVCLIVMAISLFRARALRTESPRLLVINTPFGEYVYPLDKDRAITVDGVFGTSFLTIQDGRAFFTASPCPNKDCVESAAISRSGEWTMCLPNGVAIHVEADDQTAFDATTR